MTKTCTKWAWIAIGLGAACFAALANLPLSDEYPPPTGTFVSAAYYVSFSLLLISLTGGLVCSAIGFFGSLDEKKAIGRIVSSFLTGGVGLFFLFELFLPFYSGDIRDVARRMQSGNQMKQLAFAMDRYVETNKRFPPHGTTGLSWRVYLLPYLDEKKLYDQIRLNEPWDSDWNRQFHDQMPSVYANPQCRPIFWYAKTETVKGQDGQRQTRKRLSKTTYCLIVGGESAVPGNSPIPIESPSLILDRPATLEKRDRTILIAESRPGCWMDPAHDIPFEEAIKGVNVPQRKQFYSERGIWNYGNGYSYEFQAALYDGSVRLFETTDESGKPIQYSSEILRNWLVGNISD